MSKVTDKIDEKTNELKEYSTAGKVQYENGYDMGQNHTANMYDSLGNGDYYGTKQEAQAHNDKLAATGLPYAPINDFTWSDPYGYAMEKLRGEIKDYTDRGFKYNPDEDAVYQSLDKRYKQQALDNYNENITSLARQYGGEIPAYLRQIAKNSYQTDAGKANEAIPTLSQMAWEKWGDTRNDMYNQYGLLANESAQDYGRFSDNLTRILDSQEKMWNRDYLERQMDITDKELALNEMYKKGATLWEMKSYYRSLGFSDAESERMANEDFAQFYGGYIPQAVSSSTVSANKPLGGAVVPATAKVVEDEDPENITVEDILSYKK